MDISSVASKVGKICCQDANGIASLWLLFCVVNGILALNASIILSFLWAVGNCDACSLSLCSVWLFIGFGISSASIGSGQAS